jgi:hypothetical protein
VTMPLPSAELPEPGDDVGSTRSVIQGGVPPANVPDVEPPTVWPSGRIEGRQAFDRALRQAFELAAQQGCKAWWWADADFADWPLGERATVAALNEWAGSGRRLYLLARDFKRVQAHQPRFVTWRRTWDHLIEARACPGLSVDDMPSGMWTPEWALNRLDPVRSVAVCGTDAALRTGVRLNLDEAWARATPSFPASVLGL